ncbi:MAG: response regulator transcription factor [Bacteroidota bacterium]
MIKCLIVEDEDLAAKVVETYLETLTEFELAGVVPNAIEAYNYLNDNKIDLIFLDINMPSLSGLDFLRSLKDPPLVIITTAYREYAVEGYELDVLDYLVKPISLPRFLMAIDKVHNRLHATEGIDIHDDNHILLKVDKKHIRVALMDIYYIESMKDYIRVNTTKGNYITHQTLTTITDVLPHDKFIRIHRSYTVSLDMVSALNGNALEINNRLLPIGRNYLQEVKSIVLNSGIHGS